MKMQKVQEKIAGVRCRMNSWAALANESLSEVYRKNSCGLKIGAMCGALALTLTASPAMAEDIFDRASDIMKTIYARIAGITSITAGCVAAVCIYLMIFSKNPKTVQESIQWLKRIAICWAAIMLMSTIIRFLGTGLGINTSPTLDV